MQSSHWNEVKRLFDLAREWPADRREERLLDASGGDPALVSEVMSLLDYDGAQSALLDGTLPLRRLGEEVSPPKEESSFRDPAAFEGVRVGRYRIERLIARGGMGLVFEAVQERPRRRVALKVMRSEDVSGTSSDASVRRFLLEAEVLGRLQHPGISQIFEAGLQPIEPIHDGDGEPGSLLFIAMELVEGAQSLAEHAAEHELDLERRVDLVREVCAAVHHAHECGVLHRDLKPANILVDRAGRPKVIDFGVAKLTHAEPDEARRVTATGQLVGTVLYMSPEQCDGSTRPLDRRTDVYMLGVVLYELLCGRLPYDAPTTSLYGLARGIRDREPVAPSVIDPRLGGDLEAVLLEALEKRPEQRYPTARALAEDLGRWLAGEPTRARPRGPLEKALRFARRHRTPLLAIAIAIALAAGGFAAHRAQSRRADVAERELARRSTILSSALSAAQQVVIGGGQKANGRDEVLEGVLEATVPVLMEAYSDEPAALAEAAVSLAGMYLQLGEAGCAEERLLPVLERCEEQLGADDPSTLRLSVCHDLILMRQGRIDECAGRVTENAAACIAAFGEEAEWTLIAHNNLLLAQVRRGQLRRAAKTYEWLAPRAARVFPPGGVHDVHLSSTCASMMRATGRSAQAIELLERTRERAEGVLDPGHSGWLALDFQLGNALRALGRTEEAREAFDGLAEDCAVIFGRDHPRTSIALESRARAAWDVGDHAAAAADLEEALRIRDETGPLDAPGRLQVLYGLGVLRFELDEREEALRLADECAELHESRYGPRHPTTLKSRLNLARCSLELGGHERAEELYLAYLADGEEVWGPIAPLVVRGRLDLARLLADTGRVEEARALLTSCREALAASPGRRAADLRLVDEWLAVLDPGGRGASSSPTSGAE